MKPCYKFRKVTIEEQFAKNEEEFNEIKEAYAKFKALKVNILEVVFGNAEQARIDLGMEIIDLQVCCETMLLQLGFDKQGRKKLRKLVFDKNNKRGYYDKV